MSGNPKTAKQHEVEEYNRRYEETGIGRYQSPVERSLAIAMSLLALFGPTQRKTKVNSQV